MATRKKSKKSSSLTTLVDLSPEAVQRLAKPRAGFEAYAEPMIALYRAHPEEIHITGKTPDEALDELRAYQTLQQMEREDDQHTAKVKATRALRGSGSYTTVLDIYALAKAASRHNAAIRRALLEFERFMKVGSPHKAAAAPTTPIPPATSSGT